MPKKNPSLGSAAWALEDKCTPAVEQCRGALPTSGTEDLVNAYQLELQGMALPISVSFGHFPGHQDRYVPYAALPWDAQLNVDMDALAKAVLSR